MLRICKSIENDPIFGLHSFAEHLVCDIWFTADGQDCLNKIKDEFKSIVIAYNWLSDSIVKIDRLFEKLPIFSRKRIKFAFLRNNDIESLCNGKAPVRMNQMPDIVESEIKPLFISFYEELLERSKVGGDKLEYYNSLYRANRFTYCTCCGYMAFDTGQLERREAYDHYLPKSKYPFASVNFKNLVPLCYKCNSDRKKDKDPIETGRKTFYPFRKDEIKININTTIGNGFIRSLYETIVNDLQEAQLDVPKIEDVNVNLISEEQEQVDTWDDLFQIRDRFAERTGQFSFNHLSKMKRRFNDKKLEDDNWTFSKTIDYHISDYKNDLFYDEKFLKIPFMEALKNCESLMKVYK